MKGMNVIGVIVAAVLLLTGIAVVKDLVSDYTTSRLSDSVSYEAINFTVNNTAYPIAAYTTDSTARITGTPTMHYYGNTTYEIPTARYTYNTTHFTIYANNTGGAATLYPMNVTANENYFVSYNYDYDNPQYVTGTDNTIFGVYVIFMLVAGVVLLAKFMKGED
jgi:hypothetical protein